MPDAAQREELEVRDRHRPPSRSAPRAHAPPAARGGAHILVTASFATAQDRMRRGLKRSRAARHGGWRRRSAAPAQAEPRLPRRLCEDRRQGRWIGPHRLLFLLASAAVIRAVSLIV
jgi:hypothetical protein